MKKIYFAAPLFNEMELKRNLEYTEKLEKEGYIVYLPQREAGLSARILKNNLDGRVPDEGACVELGIAYALNKKCIGIKTDDRCLDFTGDDNLFIESCLRI